MSNDHPPPRKPPARKRKALKVDEIKRQVAWLEKWASSAAYAQRAVVFAETGWRRPLPLPRSLIRYVLLQASRDLRLPKPRGKNDLMRLVEIGQLVAQGTSVWGAAGAVAERHKENRSRLYDRYREGAAIYLRIAQAADAEACIDEIFVEHRKKENPSPT